MEHIEKYNEWSNNSFFVEETRRELLEMKDDEEKIKDSFYQELEFGTAGLRGIMGVRNK